jgi:hypothetical protein
LKKARFILLSAAITLLCCIPSGATLFNSIGLSNVPIGGEWNFQVDIAFKAQVTSPLAAIRFYMINQGYGYSGGTGGRFRYELYSDNYGKPDSPLANGFLSADPQYPEWVGHGGFPIIVFPIAPVLTKGHWYHFVMTNVDSEPTINFSSADFLISSSGSNPDSNSFVQYRSVGHSWKVAYELIASPFGVYYSDGYSWGNGGYQVENGVTMCGTNYGFLKSMCWQ